METGSAILFAEPGAEKSHLLGEPRRGPAAVARRGAPRCSTRRRPTARMAEAGILLNTRDDAARRVGALLQEPRRRARDGGAGGPGAGGTSASSPSPASRARTESLTRRRDEVAGGRGTSTLTTTDDQRRIRAEADHCEAGVGPVGDPVRPRNARSQGRTRTRDRRSSRRRTPSHSEATPSRQLRTPPEARRSLAARRTHPFAPSGRRACSPCRSHSSSHRRSTRGPREAPRSQVPQARSEAWVRSAPHRRR